MEILKKLLVLGMIPTCVALATGNEIEEGPVLRKPLNHKNVHIRSYFNDSQYHKDLIDRFNRLKFDQANALTKNIVDVTEIESAIGKQVRKPDLEKIEMLSKELNEARNAYGEKMKVFFREFNEAKDGRMVLQEQFERFKNRTHPEAISRAKFRGGFIGTFTGFLVTSAYSNFSKIKSYFSRTK